MKRQAIAILVLLALVLQGSMAAFAFPSAGAGKACPMGISASSAKSCCAHHAHVTNCCLDECASIIAMPLATASLTWQAFSQPVLPSEKAALASRDDAPLIRPPIS
jgi:hypothetical protein